MERGPSMFEEISANKRGSLKRSPNLNIDMDNSISNSNSVTSINTEVIIKDEMPDYDSSPEINDMDIYDPNNDSWGEDEDERRHQSSIHKSSNEISEDSKSGILVCNVSNTGHNENMDKERDQHPSLDDDIDSDNEPVTETSKEILELKLSEKREALERESQNLKNILEKIDNRAKTIAMLEEELKDVNKVAESLPEIKYSALISSDKQLSRFAISLLYFSPKAYMYLASLIPKLPAKEEVIEWVESGRAAAIFPPEMLVRGSKTQSE